VLSTCHKPENNKRVHVAGMEMDPVNMWEKLAAVHVQKVSGVRFNALDALLTIRKSPDNSLSSVVAGVNFLLQDIKALCLEGYSMVNLNNDFFAMAMIYALGPGYAKFASSLVHFNPTCSEVWVISQELSLLEFSMFLSFVQTSSQSYILHSIRQSTS
jgi:hypothetical protein